MALRIGIRELRQNASRYLRLIEERGEPIEITDRGRPVALLTPLPHGSRLEQLIAAGRVRAGTRDELPLAVPPSAGVPPPSEALAELREHER